MRWVILAVLFIPFSPELFAQPADEAIVKAANLHHSAPTEAIELLVKNHDAIDKLNDHKLFDGNFQLFQLYNRLGQTDKAMETLEYLETRLADSRVHAPWLVLMNAQLLLIEQKFDQVDSILSPFFGQFRNHENPKLEMWHDFLVGATRVMENRYDSAFEHLNSALLKAETYQDDSVKMGVLDQLINVFYYMQNYEKSLEYCLRLLEISRSLNDKFAEVRALSNQMNIYYMMARDQKLVVMSASTDEIRQRETAKHDELDQKTSELQKQVLEISRSIGAFRTEIRALIILQNRYIFGEQYRKATELAERAIALAQKHNLTYERAVSYNNLAISLRLLGEHDRGISALQKAEELYALTKNEQSLLWVLEDYSKAYQVNGQFDLALDYHKQYHNAAMELMRKTNNNTVLELQERFESEKKEREIERLNQENRLNAAKLENEKMKRLLFVGFIFALVLILALQHNRNKTVRTKNQKLDLLNEQLKELSFKDPLTGLNNRRLLQEIQEKLTYNCLRSTEKYSGVESRIGVVLLDIDHFKNVNDTYGHDVGDEVIRVFADDFKRNLRKGDLAIRWGGEEFLVLLFNIGEDEVEKFCRRILALRNEAEVEIDALRLKITLSMGYTMFPFSKDHPEWLSWDESLKLVDNFLYLAKSFGRNKAITGSLSDDLLNDEMKHVLIDELAHSHQERPDHLVIKVVDYQPNDRLAMRRKKRQA